MATAPDQENGSAGATMAMGDSLLSPCSVAES